jgi:peroxiredoxin Q/BCP
MYFYRNISSSGVFFNQKYKAKIMKKINLILLTLLGLGMAFTYAQEISLHVGDKAPSFSATTSQGTQWDSEDYYFKDYVVVYFYPAAMTGGCTKQACSFRDNYEKIKDMNATVVGISGDEVENLKYFKMAHQLNFPLLADPEGKIAKKFGVPTRDGGKIEREIDGETVTLNRGVTSARWTFVIDKQGNIIYKDTDVNPEKDSNEVMAAIQEHMKTN